MSFEIDYSVAAENVGVTIPDGITPVEGWRSWNFVNGYLQSSHGAARWVPGKPLKAECNGARRPQYKWEMVPGGAMNTKQAHAYYEEHEAEARAALEAARDPFGIPVAGGIRVYLQFERPPSVDCPEGYGWQLQKLGHETPLERCTCGIYMVNNASDMLSGTIFGRVKGWGKVIPGDRGHRVEYAYPSMLYIPREIRKNIADYGVPMYAREDIFKSEKERTLLLPKEPKFKREKHWFGGFFY